MKLEIESLKAGQSRMMAVIANMQGDIGEIKDLLKATLPKLVTRDEFKARFDAFVADIEAARLEERA